MIGLWSIGTIKDAGSARFASLAPGQVTVGLATYGDDQLDPRVPEHLQILTDEYVSPTQLIENFPNKQNVPYCLVNCCLNPSIPQFKTNTK